MGLLRSLVTLTLALVLASSALAAAGVKKARTTHHHASHGGVVGVVASVSGDTIGVKVHHHHMVQHHARAKGKPGVAGVLPGNKVKIGVGAHKGHHGARHSTVKHFHVTKATQFIKVVSTNTGQARKVQASLRDVHRGEHVLITTAGNRHNHARLVEILGIHHPHKKLTAKARAHVKSRKRHAKAGGKKKAKG